MLDGKSYNSASGFIKKCIFWGGKNHKPNDVKTNNANEQT